MFIVLHDVLGKNKRLLEAAINLAQFPEDQHKENRDHEQQYLDVHFFSSLAAKGIVNAQAFYYPFCPQEVTQVVQILGECDANVIALQCLSFSRGYPFLLLPPACSNFRLVGNSFGIAVAVPYWASRPRCELTKAKSVRYVFLCLARGVLIQQ